MHTSAIRTKLSAWLIFVLTALFVTPAWAGGSFTLRSRQVEEVSGGWHLYVTIQLPRAPTLAHQSMRFIFTQTMEYERSLVDGRKEPVRNNVPINGGSPVIENLDVNFGDARGKIFNRTRFDFSLTRDSGFTAGEYKLEVRDSNGNRIGSPTTVKLMGDNEVVDRRSITFEAKKKKIQKVDDGTGGGDDKNKPPKDDAPTTSPDEPDEVNPEGTAPPFVDPAAHNPTAEEEIKERPKGCGCSVPGSSPLPLSALIGAAAIGLAFVLRRRR